MFSSGEDLVNRFAAPAAVTRKTDDLTLQPRQPGSNNAVIPLCLAAMMRLCNQATDYHRVP